jgi:hypothetical protein
VPRDANMREPLPPRNYFTFDVHSHNPAVNRFASAMLCRSHCPKKID